MQSLVSHVYSPLLPIIEHVTKFILFNLIVQHDWGLVGSSFSAYYEKRRYTLSMPEHHH